MDPYQNTFRLWDKVAGLYQEGFMDLELYNDTYDKFCELIITPNARVYEIGCGPGNITRYLLQKRPDFQLFAIDNSSNMLALAKEQVPAARFKLMDCRETDKITERFDAVICGFCLPYLAKADCEKLFSDVANLLHNDSIFYFSAIEGDYEDSGFETGRTNDQMYVYYYDEIYLRDLLLKNGFDLLDFTRKSYTKSNGENSDHLIFIAGKKQ